MIVRLGSAPCRFLDTSSAGILAVPQTKAGTPRLVRVSKRALAAVKRVREAGSFSRAEFDKAVRDACVSAKVEPFTAAMFRHTVASQAVEKGADPAAAFLGHKGPEVAADQRCVPNSRAELY